MHLTSSLSPLLQWSLFGLRWRLQGGGDEEDNWVRAGARLMVLFEREPTMKVRNNLLKPLNTPFKPLNNLLTPLNAPFTPLNNLLTPLFLPRR